MSTKKHAFLISAFQFPDYLEDLINSLDGEMSNIYVHINKRNLPEFQGLISKMRVRHNVHFVESIVINWGGMSLLKSLKILLDSAYANKENDYFHFLTGQDMLIRPINELYSFFENTNLNYIKVDKELVPSDASSLRALERFYYYHTYDILEYRSSILSKIVEKGSVALQRFLHFRRKLPADRLYMGSGWFSLNRDAISIVIEEMHDNKRFNKWKYTFAAEEHFTHSVIMNSVISDTIANDNLRYMYWDFEKKLFPATLTAEYIESAVSSYAFFARKIHPVVSKGFIDGIKRLY